MTELKKTYHIIVADDDEDDQLLISEAISKIKHISLTITPAFNGAELLKLLPGTPGSKETINPDFIILDVNMPVMDGVEALKRIKKNDSSKNIPVFIVSTLRAVDNVETFMILGAANFYSKPNTKKGYLDIIEEIVSNVYKTHSVK